MVYQASVILVDLLLRHYPCCADRQRCTGSTLYYRRLPVAFGLLLW